MAKYEKPGKPHKYAIFFLPPFSPPKRGNFVIYYLIGIVPIKAMIFRILSGSPPGCRYSLHSAAALPVLEKDQSSDSPESS